MTIRKLEKAGLIEFDSKLGVSDTTIAFALDSGYLECFKVFVRSLAYRESLIDCQVAIYTDDEVVLNDPIVKLVSDKIVLLEGEKKELLYGLAKNNVKRPERSNWNRGTFLKWSCFEPQDNPQLLFLDVDMICANKVEPLLKLHKGYDFLCAPQFQKSLKMDNNDSPLAADDVYENVNSLLNSDFSNLHDYHQYRLNSGMMLIRNSLLSHDFFYEVTGFAKSRMELHEQGHLSQYFQLNENLRKMVSSSYNFHESYLGLLKREDMHSALKRISIIHYAGGSKPWSSKLSIVERQTKLLWHAFRTHSENLLKLN